MQKRSLMIALAVLAGATSAHGIVWSVDYQADTLPNLASPAWSHANAGGTTSVNGGVLTMTSGSPAANNSWDRVSDGPLTGATMTNFFYNNPDVAGTGVVPVTGRAITIEWRMKVNGPATLAPSDQTGLKIDYGLGSLTGQFTFYYDAVNQRLANTRFPWGTGGHEGRRGFEGGEVQTFQDGFDNIALGEWHTYKLTAANLSGTWFRELWLDGSYVGRWWTESSAGSSRDIKMRTNTTATPNASIDIDFLRYSAQPDGRYITSVPEPASIGLLSLGALLLVRRRQ